jgi:hypothetical protein
VRLAVLVLGLLWVGLAHGAHPRSFPLEGGHAAVTCVQCHPQAARKKFAGAPRACAACHQVPAHGDFGACEPCHTIAAFRPSGFSHDITRFALRGAHAPLPCQRCHTGAGFQAFDDGPGRCLTCHQNPHDAARDACADCHAETAWKPVTGAGAHQSFPLEGRHAQAACESCHQGGRFAGTPRACASCHTDRHQGRLGKDCARCHDARAWRPTHVPFDHWRETGVPLDGAHGRLDCAACHGPPGKPRVLSVGGSKATCATCHTPRRHGLQYGTACASCHVVTGWYQLPRFDHDRTGFRLERGHRMVACASCHDVSRSVRATPACVACHEDLHRGRAGIDCESCHRPDHWQRVRFDHDRAEFRLAGRHRITPCTDCHQNDTWRGLRPECITCHAADRPRTSDHLAVTDCAGAGCHTALSWSIIR